MSPKNGTQMTEAKLDAKLNNLDGHGKAFGYNVKLSKCQLIVKENCRKSAIMCSKAQILQW